MIDREEKWEKVAERMAILKEQGVPYIFVVWSEGLPILDVMLTTNVEPFFLVHILLSHAFRITGPCSQSVMGRDCLFMITGQGNETQKLKLNYRVL